MVLRVSVASGLLLVALTGVGAGPMRTLTAPMTLTLPAERARTGEAISCRHGDVFARGVVPARGHSVGVVADGIRGAATLQLTRRRNGSLRASCRG